MARKGQEFTWENFPKKKTAEGWHCRKCGVVLTGRRSSWCGKACEKAVLMLVDWTTIRRTIRRRDKWTCLICGVRADDVDHIVELMDGGSFHDLINLRSLCHPCHKAKTLFLRSLRAQLKKEGKLPADLIADLYKLDSIMKRHFFGNTHVAKRPENADVTVSSS